MPTIEFYRSRSLLRSERWRWRLRSGNGQVVAVSGEGYANQEECVAMAHRIMVGEFADATVVRSA